MREWKLVRPLHLELLGTGLACNEEIRAEASKAHCSSNCSVPARASQLNPGVHRAREAGEGACDCAYAETIVSSYFHFMNLYNKNKKHLVSEISWIAREIDSCSLLLQS